MTAAQALSPDEAGTEDAEVVDVLSPNEAVMPVIVAVVLERLPLALRFGCIVAAGGEAVVGSRRGENGCSLLKKKRDIALEVNGVTGVNACREDNRASARVGGCIDGSIDSWCVNRCAIALCAKAADIKVDGLRSGSDARAGLRLWPRGRRVQKRGCAAGHGQSGHLQEFPAKILHALFSKSAAMNSDAIDSKAQESIAGRFLHQGCDCAAVAASSFLSMVVISGFVMKFFQTSPVR